RTVCGSFADAGSIPAASTTFAALRGCRSRRSATALEPCDCYRNPPLPFVAGNGRVFPRLSPFFIRFRRARAAGKLKAKSELLS
ncbi:MAG: hypothetical protein ACOVK7_01195, partial [Burkholderiaceae bacterium]